VSQEVQDSGAQGDVVSAECIQKKRHLDSRGDDSNSLRKKIHWKEEESSLLRQRVQTAKKKTHKQMLNKQKSESWNKSLILAVAVVDFLA
jgi:hypothetical protein